MSTLSLTIFGSPRTKKNHGRLVRAGGRHRMLPSKPYEIWCAGVALQLRGRVPQLPDQPYNVEATFYRDRAVGDAVGFYQALADALEVAGVVSNDKYFTQWDGSRLAVDKQRPRVEVTIRPIVAGAGR